MSVMHDTQEIDSTRRRLLQAGALASLATTLPLWGSTSGRAAAVTAPYTLPSLPYAFDALEPAVDARTMEIHHGRHHKAYVDGLNAKVEAFPALADMPLEQVLARVSTYDEGVRNHGGGHYNHSLFWQVMAEPGHGTAPSAALQAAIARDFGSDAAFRDAFAQAAASQFGSGWAWLIVQDGGRLAVTGTANQDNPLMDVVDTRGTPVLGLDVWEHAYYLQYQNRRPAYIDAWWAVVNWAEVDQRYAATLRG